MFWYVECKHVNVVPEDSWDGTSRAAVRSNSIDAYTRVLTGPGVHAVRSADSGGSGCSVDAGGGCGVSPIGKSRGSSVWSWSFSPRFGAYLCSKRRINLINKNIIIEKQCPLQGR